MHDQERTDEDRTTTQGKGQWDETLKTLHTTKIMQQHSKLESKKKTQKHWNPSVLHVIPEQFRWELSTTAILFNHFNNNQQQQLMHQHIIEIFLFPAAFLFT